MLRREGIDPNQYIGPQSILTGAPKDRDAFAVLLPCVSMSCALFPNAPVIEDRFGASATHPAELPCAHLVLRVDPGGDESRQLDESFC